MQVRSRALRSPHTARTSKDFSGIPEARKWQIDLVVAEEKKYSRKYC